MFFGGKYNKRLTQREIKLFPQITSGLNRKYVAENKGGNLSCGEIFSQSFLGPPGVLFFDRDIFKIARGKTVHG